MKGDVLLIDFPFSRGGGSKVRPALSVQGNAVQSVNTIIAQITMTVTLHPARRINIAGLFTRTSSFRR